MVGPDFHKLPLFFQSVFQVGEAGGGRAGSLFIWGTLDVGVCAVVVVVVVGSRAVDALGLGVSSRGRHLCGWEAIWIEQVIAIVPSKY